MEHNKLLLAELYTAYFNRVPDAAGLNYWLNELENGFMTFDQISSNWANEQQEFIDTYGENVNINTLITQVYANVLGRSPDADGADYWTAELASGNIPMDQFIQAVVNGAKASTGSASDAALLNNKAQVGVKVADSGINNIEFAKKAVEAVTSDTKTVDIVSSIVDMGKTDAASLTQATGTLSAVKELIVANASNATTLSSVLENVKTLVSSVAAKAAAGEVANIASSLSAVKTTVTAAKTDASFIQDAAAKADSIASNPTAVEQEATAIIPVETTPEPAPTTPSTGGGGGGSSTPAPTFTASVDENGTITFSGTATGNITMNGGDSSEGDTQDVTFTRGGVTTSTVTLDANSEISVASGQTYVITAAQANEAVIEGEGTVNITNLEDTLDADLSYIETDNFTASFDATTETPEAAFNFTGNLGNAKINITGNGALSIHGATVGENASFDVASTTALIGTSTQLSTKAITGSGVVMFDIAANTDTSNFASTLTVAAQVSTTVDISENALLANVDQYVVHNNKTLTLTAAQASAVAGVYNNGEIGAGSTIVLASDSNDNFHILTTGMNNIAGGLGADTITLAEGTGTDTVVVGGGTTVAELEAALATAISDAATTQTTLDNAIAAAATTQTTLDAAIAAAATTQTDLDTATTADTAADEAVAAAQALVDARTTLSAAVTDAEAALATDVSSNGTTETLNTALTNATTAAATTQTTLDAAIAAAATTQTDLDAATAADTAADEAVAAATTADNAADALVTTTTTAVSDAETALATAVANADVAEIVATDGTSATAIKTGTIIVAANGTVKATTIYNSVETTNVDIITLVEGILTINTTVVTNASELISALLTASTNKESADTALTTAISDAATTQATLDAATTAAATTQSALDAATTADTTADAAVVTATTADTAADEAVTAAQALVDARTALEATVTSTQAALAADITANGETTALNTALTAATTAATATQTALNAATTADNDADAAVVTATTADTAADAAVAAATTADIAADEAVVVAQAAVNASLPSDSPFATPDTITNFTPDTDKLQIASSSAVATGTSGIIGDNSVNTDDVAIGSTGASIDFGTVTNGVIVFSDDAGTPAEITIDSSDAMTAALTYLSTNISDGDTVAFDYDIDSVSGTIVFQGDAGGDIAVNLIGVSASSLGADLDLVALV